MRNFIRLMILAVSLGGMTGCAEYYAGSAAIKSEGAKIADEELLLAQYADCVASTMGANLRRYGTSAATWEARRLNCFALAGAAAIVPQPVQPAPPPAP